ncbi:24916_t:CDS:1, partial [Gigaspora margarita]
KKKNFQILYAQDIQMKLKTINTSCVAWQTKWQIREVLIKSLDKWAKKEDKKNKTYLTLEQKHDFLERHMTIYLNLNTNWKIGIITQDVE